MIQNIFNTNNTNKLPGKFVVEQLIPFVGSPEIAEAYIMEMVKANTMIKDGKYLILSVPKSEPEPESQPDNSKIKKAWFQLRQLEKTNISASKFKIYAECFVRQFEWNYYILNNELRKECEKLGYRSVPSERSMFNKEVLQK